MKIKKSILLTFALLAIVTFAVSCHKKKDTIAKITVYDGNNAVVPDCRVVLYGQASNPQDQGNVVVYDTAYTNTSGNATFYFNDIYQLGQAGVAILNINARKGNLAGKGVVKIVEEEMNSQKVIIHP